MRPSARRRLTVFALAVALAMGAADAHAQVPDVAPETRATRPHAARLVVGEVDRVRDGDTIVVAGVAVRLWGLHAPELHEAGGPAARRWMIDRTRQRIVTCERLGRRSHDRMVAACRTDEGDLAAGLIAAGLGRDCPRFSRGTYAGQETDSGRTLALPSYCQTR